MERNIINKWGLQVPTYCVIALLGENESIITVTATEIASKNKPGIYYVTDDPGTGVYIPVGCSFVLVRKIYSNRSIQIAFNTWSYDGNKVFYRRSDDNNSFANKAWIRNYDEGILTDSTIMSSLASALGGYVLACKRVSYSNFDSIDDVLGDYFIILGDPPASWGSPLPYGSLISFSFSDYCFQIVFPHKEYYSDGIKYRMNNGSGWGEWKTIVLT